MRNVIMMGSGSGAMPKEIKKPAKASEIPGRIHARYGFIPLITIFIALYAENTGMKR
ncbi:MAG: hypothetical protein IKJ65_07120 [Clostridia bacterium]|nr:hypothetical protein [Clostridia bacterium]